MHLSPFCLYFDASHEPVFTSDDDRFFWRALKNAQFAMGMTHPNPAVGAVVVKDGIILAEGYTHSPGGMHAEKHALLCAASSPRGATMYVTLEPCSHFGRTSPCANAVIDAGIIRVVYGAVDPNPKVCGRGLHVLRDAGIETVQIEHPMLRDMAHAMLAPFASWVVRKRPYVVVKIATSADGFFARGAGVRTKITGSEADAVVHAMRRGSDAIMVGGSTVRIDDPELTSRIGDRGHGQQPASVIVSAHGQIHPQVKLCKRESRRSLMLVPHEIATSISQALPEHHLEIIGVDADSAGINLKMALHKLGELLFTLVFVEAGPRLFTALLEQQLIDEIIWFRARHAFNADGPAIPNLHALIMQTYSCDGKARFGDDEMMFFHPLPTSV